MSKVLVGMSGGIDSSVAAYLLKEQGHEVTGVTMAIWKEGREFHGDLTANACFAPTETKDIEHTKQICKSLGIKHKVIDISELYEQIVLGNFRSEYLNGRTPNPCIWCNHKIKFGAMVDRAREEGLDFDYFATGHYARIEKQENGRYALLRSVDLSKDQSYFLYRLTQQQLSTTLFPLGNMTKKEVREIDVKLGFHPEGMTESQDFYSGAYSDLLDVKPREGNIVDKTGKVLGRHSGVWNYTIGQRKGLGIGAPRPLYVIELRVKTNEVVVGFEEDTKDVSVEASQIVWGAVDTIENEIEATAKIRSAGSAIECKASLTQTSETENNKTENNKTEKIKAVFKNPVKAATCGQSLVLYDGDRVLCGGIIEGKESLGLHDNKLV